MFSLSYFCVCVYRQVTSIQGAYLVVSQGLSGLPMHFLAYNCTSKVCATGKQGWSRPRGRLLYLRSLGKPIYLGSPQHGPSSWHTLAAPQTHLPCPGIPLPVTGQWRPQSHRGFPCNLQCSTGDCGWCGLCSGKAHEQKKQAQQSCAALFRTWKQLVAIIAGCVFVCEPRQALSRAAGRREATVRTG